MKHTYTAYTVEIDGLTENVRYTIRRNKNVVVHLLTAGVPMELTPDDPDYAAALQAANERRLADAIAAGAKLQAAREDGSKWWIGQVIKGDGWTIEADAATERIRVTFKRRPSEAQKQAVIDAGFRWSPVMKSWNRGLKCKAWRAAEQLGFVLKDMSDPAHRWSKAQEREAV